MADLRDVIAYLCDHYPDKDDLSKARLTKMIYLADWRSAITRGAQITDITWIFNHYGPYVDDVVEMARNDPIFEVLTTENEFGTIKEVIQTKWRGEEYQSLTEGDRGILDFVVERTASRNFRDFIRLVYSTYPVVAQPRYSSLDLVALAREYSEVSPSGKW
jgi:hypothetical protein